MISDERLQRLLRVEVNEQTSVIDAEQAQQLSLGIDLNGNKGFEGLAYDTAGQRLYVAKERNPVRIYEISGFPFAEPTPSVHISEHQARLFVRDLPACSSTSRPATCWRFPTSRGWWSSWTPMASRSAACR